MSQPQGESSGKLVLPLVCWAGGGAVEGEMALLFFLLLPSTAGRRAGLGVLRVRGLAMSLTSSNTQEGCTAHSLGSGIELAPVVVGFAGKLALGRERGRAGRLNSSDPSPAQVQDYDWHTLTSTRLMNCWSA